MYWTLIRNDIKASKMITGIILLFIIITSILFSVATMLAVNLAGSIDNLMSQAKTPHFLQMHSGELHKNKILEFAASCNDVEAIEISTFVNIDNSKLILGETRMDNNVQDNGICIQNRKFDYLLDLDGNIIHPKTGEIYVPTAYWKQKLVQKGDTIKIENNTLRVAGFLRDSQMNSMLASSKRFLVSEEDFQKLKSFGKEEYLIEFRLKNLESLSDFEQNYMKAGLDADGPTVTYPLFRVMNAISDGLVIATLLFISGIIVIVAFLCIRFTLLAKMEEECREIGVMKAIGLRYLDVRQIYLRKYQFVAGIGCLTGFLISMCLRGVILENIRLYFGEEKNQILSIFFCLLAVVVVYGMMITLVKIVLRRFKKVSILEAMHMEEFGNKKNGNYLFSQNCRGLDANRYLAIRDVSSRKKLYVTVFFIVVLAVFISLVPRNLYCTISSGSFITFMGTGKCDVRIDLMQNQNPEQYAKQMKTQLLESKKTSKVASLNTKRYEAKLKDGSTAELKITTGDIDIFPLMYSSGHSPRSENEVALSVLNAEELHLLVGDTLILIINGQEKKLIVSGIYSDITNGGKTARANFLDPSKSTISSVICVDFTDESDKASEIQIIKKLFPLAKISDTSEYVKQTMGTTILAIQVAMYVAFIISLGILVLMVSLFMGLLVTKDRFNHVVLKALGFYNRDIKKQYMYRLLFVSVAGVLAGTIMANTLGEKIAGLMIQSFGASTFEFTINPWMTYLLIPVLFIVTVILTMRVSIRKIGKINITTYIKEL